MHTKPLCSLTKKPYDVFNLIKSWRRSPLGIYSSTIIMFSSSVTTPCNCTTLLCTNWPIMAASLRNFTLSDSEHCELRVFTATCTGSTEPLDHKPRWTVPNSPDPSCSKILMYVCNMYYVNHLIHYTYLTLLLSKFWNFFFSNKT